jgi:hypothetical protein
MWTCARRDLFRGPALIYHPGMTRVAVAVWASLILTLACVTSVGTANAEPWPPSPCGFTLSPPQVEAAGQPGGSCMQGTDTAQVYFSQPYKPGTTYLSRGRGCGIIVPTLPADNCQILGPISATL